MCSILLSSFHVFPDRRVEMAISNPNYLPLLLFPLTLNDKHEEILPNAESTRIITKDKNIKT